MTKQQEKVYKKLYKVCSKLNEIAYKDWIVREKQGERIETQPFKPHELTIPIIETMEKVMNGSIDPNEGMDILRTDEIKSALSQPKLLTSNE